MKTCPVCKARCFDDMEVCYGCMYRFGEGGGYAGAGGAEAPEPRGLNPSPRRAPEYDGGAPRAAPAPAAPAPARAEPAKGAPHVFGALDAGDAPSPAPDAGADGQAGEARPEAAPSGVRPAEPEDAGRRDPVQRLPSPLVTASLGNGYRLVISLEPE